MAGQIGPAHRVGPLRRGGRDDLKVAAHVVAKGGDPAHNVVEHAVRAAEQILYGVLHIAVGDHAEGEVLRRRERHLIDERRRHGVQFQLGVCPRHPIREVLHGGLVREVDVPQLHQLRVDVVAALYCHGGVAREVVGVDDELMVRRVHVVHDRLPLAALLVEVLGEHRGLLPARLRARGVIGQRDVEVVVKLVGLPGVDIVIHAPSAGDGLGVGFVLSDGQFPGKNGVVSAQLHRRTAVRRYRRAVLRHTERLPRHHRRIYKGTLAAYALTHAIQISDLQRRREALNRQGDAANRTAAGGVSAVVAGRRRVGPVEQVSYPARPTEAGEQHGKGQHRRKDALACFPDLRAAGHGAL